MASPVLLPAPIPGFVPLDCPPEDAELLGTDLRTVAVNLQDVREWADARSAPADWCGDAAEAAAGSGNRFARSVDGAETALQLAVVAATVLEDHLVRLRQRRATIDTARGHLNTDIHALERRIRLVEVDEGQAREAARHLFARARTIVQEITTWLADVDAAEATFVAALRKVDAVPEGAHAAATTHLPDALALLRNLRGLSGRLAATTAWWRSLSAAQRQALVLAYPAVVGAADGIPVVDRNRANQADIGATLVALEQQDPSTLSPLDRRALANLEAVQDRIDGYAHHVDPVTGRGLFNVIDYDPYAYDGDGTSITSLGDPDLAGHVATYTPGLTTQGGRLSDLGSVVNLYDAMRGDRGGVAAVLYENYDAPDFGGMTDVGDSSVFDAGLKDAAGVTDVAAARAGGHHLAGFLDALGATHHGGDQDVTVVGHSYGSVVAAYAAQQQPDIDNAVLLAGPGVPGHDVHDLVGDSGIHVYVGADDHDPVSLLGSGPLGGLGTLGTDPAAASYGATRIGEDPSPESLAGVLGFGNHSSAHYLGPHTEGLANVAQIATGGTPDVVAGRTSDNYQSLGDLVAHAGLGATAGPADAVLYDHGGRQVLHAVEGAIPGGVRNAVGVGVVDAATGAVTVVDGGLHAVHGAAGILAPSDPVAGLVDRGLDGLMPTVDSLRHDADSVLSTLKGLL